MPLNYISYFRDYSNENKSLFLNDKIGLLDTINKKHVDIWNMYKLLKSLDWDELEVNYSSCKAEFKSLDKELSDIMIYTLAWQWEADSSASMIGSILMPFISSTELVAYIAELSKNEILHSITYSEIVKNSFDNPDEVITKMLSIKESFARLETVSKNFDEFYTLSHNYALGNIDKNDTILKKGIIKFFITILCLERVQFMPSFVITFGMAEIGNFLPIAKIVQKICNDEFQVHVQTDKLILSNELNTVEGLSVFISIMDEVQLIIKEIVEQELTWIDYLYKDKDMLLNISKKDIRNFVIYSVTDIYTFLNLDNPYGNITVNPLPFMNKWININSNQASPQEENVVNYLLGGFIDDEKKTNLQLTF